MTAQPDPKPEGAEANTLRIHAPRIRLDQWRTVARVAAEHAGGSPLHLTTRQNVELHGVTAEHVAPAQDALDGVGLRAVVRSCGDTLRRVVLCPGHGKCPGSVDVTDVAVAIRSSAETLPFIDNMPRKFKISISGCGKGCAMPWINDLGLVARPDGTFRAILAGKLGARPGAGIVLYEELRADDLVPLAIGALRLFNAEGDRENRAQARFRFVRKRLGEETFAARLDEAFQKEKAEGTWPVPTAQVAEDNGVVETRLRLPLGDIAPDAALRLADIVEKSGSELRVGLNHDLFLYGPTEPDLDPDLKTLVDEPCIVTCPGSTWCRRGIADSRGAATRIRAALSDGRDLMLCVGGCPNSCAHGAIADVGLTGLVATVNGERTECFRLLAGGGHGATAALAEELHPAVPAAVVDRVVAYVAEELTRLKQPDDHAFTDVVHRERERLVRAVKEIVEQP